jgi:hypothetical protein
VNLVFAGLLAMNFFEPLAAFITGYQDDIHTFVAFIDFLSFWICFIFFMAIFMAITDKVSRVRVRFMQIVERVGAPIAAACVGWVMACIVLASLHTAPLAEYPLLGSFQPQANMGFGMFAPDREWFGFTKYQSSGPYCRSNYSNPFPDDFIVKQDIRRQAIETYTKGAGGIRVNPQFIKAAPKSEPAKKP